MRQELAKEAKSTEVHSRQNDTNAQREKAHAEREEAKKKKAEVAKKKAAAAKKGKAALEKNKKNKADEVSHHPCNSCHHTLLNPLLSLSLFLCAQLNA